MHACLCACGIQSRLVYRTRPRRILRVRSSALVCMCECRGLHACVHAVHRADLYTVFWPKADTVGQVLSPSVCVSECLCV